MVFRPSRLLVVLFALVVSAAARPAVAQQLLLFEDFEGANPEVDLNDDAAGRPSMGTNQWIVNADYTDPNGTYPPTVNQNTTAGGTINNAPNSRYLHIRDSLSQTTTASYDPAVASEQWAEIDDFFCTQGMTDVEFGFFYTLNGSPDAFAEVYFRVNFGPWERAVSTSGDSVLTNQSVWQFISFKDTALDNQANVQIAIRWVNNANPAEPQSSARGIGVDDFFVQATGDTSLPTATIQTNALSNAVCTGAPLEVEALFGQELCDGQYSLQLSNPGGTFPNSPGELTFTNASGTQDFGQSTTIFNFQTDTFGSPPTEFVTIPPVPDDNCYRVRWVREGSTPPMLVGQESGCIDISNCPNTITTREPIALTNDTICVGSAIDIPFNSDGVFQSNNTYTAEISDTNGSFNSPQVVGTFSSGDDFPDPMEPGNVSGIVPGVPEGCGYVLRITSSSPSTDSANIVEFGPFCVKECDIETNERQDLNICLSDTSGDTLTISYDINEFDSSITYGPNNYFSIEALSMMDFTPYDSLDWGELGQVQATDSGTVQLRIPIGPDFMSQVNGETSMYLRVNASSSSDTTDTTGTLIRLTIGFPVTQQRSISVFGDTVICSNSSGQVTLSVSPGNPFNPNDQTYNWCIGGGGTPNCTMLDSRFVTINTGSQPGTIEVWTTEIHNGCPGPPSDTAEIEIIIQPDFQSVSDTIQQCVGDTSTFSVPFVAQTAYNWNFDPDLDVLDVSNDQSTFTTNQPGVFDLRVRATNKCGADTATVRVEALDFPSVTAMPDTQVCAGDSLSLSANVSPSGLDYLWSNDAGLPTSPQSMPSVFPPEGDTTSFVLEYGHFSAGCITRDSLTVTTSEPGRILNTDTLICSGDAVPLAATGADGYAWTPAAQVVSPTDANTQSLALDSAATFRVVMTDTLANDSVCIAEDSVQVSVNFVQLLSNDTSICPGSTIPLAATGADSYAWTPPAVVEDPSAANTQTTALDSAATFRVVMVDSLAGGGLCLEEDSFQVSLQTPQSAGMLELERCIEDGDTLIEASEPSAAYYHWNTGDTTQQIGPVTVGQFEVVYLANGQCLTETFNLDTIRCEQETQVQVFVPNVFSPNSDGINDELRYDLEGIRSVQFIVFNRWGEEVFQTSSLGEFWDGDGADPGVYFWRMRGETTTDDRFERAGKVTLVR